MARKNKAAEAPAQSDSRTSKELSRTFVRVVWVTGAWFSLMALLLAWPHLRTFSIFNGVGAIPYALYYWTRTAAVFALVGLGVAGLIKAGRLAAAKSPEPWYHSPFLVSLSLFWALFPPMWFFVEYYLLDRGSIELPAELIPPDTTTEAAKKANDAKVAFLGVTKTYADMAAKVWAAVGASLAAVIAISKK